MTKTVTIQAQQKWEYHELTRKTETYLAAELNELGQQGWELVSINYAKDRKGEWAWTAFLKRPYVAHGPAVRQEREHAEAYLAAGQVRIEPQHDGAEETFEELRFKEE